MGITIIFWVLILILSHSSTIDAEEVHLPKNFEHCLVLFEKRLMPDSAFIAHGTGFILADTLHEKAYIITNRHLIIGRDSIFAKFNIKDSSRIEGVRKTLYLIQNGEEQWTGHADTLIDLAVIDISRLLPNYYFVSPSRFKLINDVKLGDDIFFLGFPLAEIVADNINYPMLRSGTVAYKTQNHIVNMQGSIIVPNTHILIDGQSMGGFSGSPILSTPIMGERLSSVIGIISSHVTWREDSAIVDPRLAVCVPSDYIIELLGQIKGDGNR